jgi:2-polyprenyl-3-methyl-5-hydroxy-6-metoxy-1,4-benzoquinol methylase
MNSCRICGNHNTSNDYFVAKEMMFGFRDEFVYFRCEKCGCVQIENFPTNISKYYPDYYYSLGGYDGKRFQGFWGSVYKLRNRASFFRDSLFLRVLHFVSPIGKYEVFQGLGITKKSRILDVGCGNGDFFIYPFKELGLEKVAGCDPFIEENLDYTNGLKIYKTDIFGMKGERDLIIFNHSFEHLQSPYDNLAQAKKLLAPDGICIIRTPVVPCFAWNRYGINWFQLDAPRHFIIQSTQSLLAMSLKAKLKIEKIEYDSTHHQFTASEGYQRNEPLIYQTNKKTLADNIKRLQFSRLAKRLNKKKEGDQAAFILRNIAD